jgi:preprotein translocase subunit SecY
MTDLGGERNGGPWVAALGAGGSILAIYVLGRQIPLPGIALQAVYGDYPSQGVLGYFLFSRGAIDRLSLFALGVIPFFLPLAVLELAKLMFPRLARWQIGSADNLFRLGGVVRACGLLIAVMQSYLIARALTDIPGIVAEDVSNFVLPAAASMFAGCAFLSWLADRITQHGLLNGFWLLWIIPSIAAVPRHVASCLELLRTGGLAPLWLLVAVAWMIISLLAAVVLNYLLIDRRLAASASPEAALQIRLRTSALIWPPLLAGAIVGLFAPAAPRPLFEDPGQPRWFEYGTISHMAILALLVMLFAYAYAKRPVPSPRAVIDLFAPENRVSLPAPSFWLVGLVQAAICVGGEILVKASVAVPFGVDGTLIVVVTVVMALMRNLSLQRLVPPHASSFG